MTKATTNDTLGLRGADAAMLRVADDVRRIAAQTGTPLAVWKDGHVVRIPVTDAAAAVTPQQSPVRP
jgi:hypothetical protein